MKSATLHRILIERTLDALSEPNTATMQQLYAIIHAWLEAHPRADVYERFKARTALQLLHDTIIDLESEKGHDSAEAA